jgi:hypothetical protein
MFPVRYELGFYIPDDGILRSHRRENLKYYNWKTRFGKWTCFSLQVTGGRYLLCWVPEKELI